MERKKKKKEKFSITNDWMIYVDSLIPLIKKLLEIREFSKVSAYKVNI